MCGKSQLDKHYVFDGSSFQGFTGGSLFWDEASAQWRIQSREGHVSACVGGEKFPIGKQILW